MSRLLWMGIGAVGGIYLYRRGDRAWGVVKARGVAGNASLVAGSAATMLNHAKTGLADAQEAKNARELGGAVPVTESGPQSPPARVEQLHPTVPVQDPQTQVIYEMRAVPVADHGQDELAGEAGAPAGRSGGTAFERVRTAARVLAGYDGPRQESQNRSAS